MTEACVLCMWCDRTFTERIFSFINVSFQITHPLVKLLQRSEVLSSGTKRNCVFWVWLCHLLWSSAPWIEGFRKHEVSFRFVVYNTLPIITERKKADYHVCKIFIKTNGIPQESFDCSTAFIHRFFSTQGKLELPCTAFLINSTTRKCISTALTWLVKLRIPFSQNYLPHA